MAPFGLEILHRLVEPRSKQECILVALHANLLSHGFLCLHMQEDINVASNVECSELLPNGWNARPDVFELQYVRDDQKFIVKAVAANMKNTEKLIISVLRLFDDKDQHLDLKVDEWISDNFSTYKGAFKDGFNELLENKLIKPFLEQIRPPRAASSSISSRSTESREPGMFIPRPSPDREIPFPDPFAVGIGDLDPLAGGRGGGMLMDPRHQRPPIQPGIPGNFPRGAVPPGARFDPFGPPPPDQILPGVIGGRPRPQPRGGFGDPDPDHLPPPPGSDDMFM